MSVHPKGFFSTYWPGGGGAVAHTIFLPEYNAVPVAYSTCRWLLLAPCSSRSLFTFPANLALRLCSGVWENLNQMRLACPLGVTEPVAKLFVLPSVWTVLAWYTWLTRFHCFWVCMAPPNSHASSRAQTRLACQCPT